MGSGFPLSGVITSNFMANKLVSGLRVRTRQTL